MRPLAALVVALALAAPSAQASAPARGLLLLAVTQPPGGPASTPVGPVHLWTLSPRDGATARDLGAVGRYPAQFLEAQLAPDGRHILVLEALRAIVDASTPAEIDELDLSGRRMRTLVRLAGITRFAVAPNGSRIAFTRVQRNGHGAAYLLTVGRHTPTLVRNGWEPTGSFAWLANGKIVVANQWSYCRALLCAYDPATGLVERLRVDLTQKPGGVAPTYSPDARRIAFSSVLGPAGVRIVPLAGGPGRNVPGAYCNGPFSPDGARLVVTDGCSADAAEAPQLYDLATHRLEPLRVGLPFAPGSTYAVADWR